MSRRLILGGAAIAASATLLLPAVPASARTAGAVTAGSPARTGAVTAASTTMSTTPASPANAPVSAAGAVTATAPAPSAVAKKLFRAWLRADRGAAARVATPSAVRAIFSYRYRAPDEFAGCRGTACRFVHTSVRVRGGLNGVLMVVSGSKVTGVYTSRLLTTPSAAARHLFSAWRRGDRNAGLEVATTAAVGRLFRTAYDPRGVRHIFQGCTPEPHGQACAYYYEGGAMVMHARGSAATGYEIHSIGYLAD
ncbi:hypothetical protein [Streptosporangium sandarakinum]|uniref:Uncharacterized protein n=1 Tax=Streptosporangium sandarakinum TaxID=1260955 RepID=A0A852URR5_9ACTN|nr:hypothetical protein [Streptosporangium sandarakinum]NYF38106.1 hypothetical protein [Streptosporangium sandarakinum]